MTTMRAWTRDAYGGPEVLHLREVPRPVPGAGEVLVRVCATTVAAGDGFLLVGRPYLLRLVFGLARPKHTIVGMDLAGVVEAVGPGVEPWRPGDEVLGEVTSGACAEYVCVRAEQLARKPPGTDFAEAAALPVGGCTALQGLRDAGRVEAGQKVLIVGASGGVGCLAVQIAKALGAEVTAVCSGQNAGWVRALGADHVVDYTVADYTAGEARYDVILDMIGDRTVSECRRVLAPRGVYVSGAGGAENPWMGPLPRILTTLVASATGSQRLVPLAAKATGPDLDALRQMVEAGRLRPVIDRRFGFDAVPAAYRAQAEGHARGRIVVTM